MGERLLQHPGVSLMGRFDEKDMGRSKEQMSENTRCGYTLHGYNIMTQCRILCYTILDILLLLSIVIYYIILLYSRQGLRQVTLPTNGVALVPSYQAVINGPAYWKFGAWNAFVIFSLIILDNPWQSLIPSGKQTVCYWKWPSIVDLLIRNCDFP